MSTVPECVYIYLPLHRRVLLIIQIILKLTQIVFWSSVFPMETIVGRDFKTMYMYKKMVCHMMVLPEKENLQTILVYSTKKQHWGIML